MNREDMMKLLQECGFGTLMDHPTMTENMMRFGALVAEREREACELTVDSLIISGPVSEVQQRHNWAYMHARDAIRARGEQEQPR